MVLCLATCIDHSSSSSGGAIFWFAAVVTGVYGSIPVFGAFSYSRARCYSYHELLSLSSCLAVITLFFMYVHRVGRDVVGLVSSSLILLSHVHVENMLEYDTGVRVQYCRGGLGGGGFST